MTTKRTGSGGRPALGSPSKEKSQNLNLTIPAELNRRLTKYCEDEERAKSWATQKALDIWLTERCY